MKKYLFFAFIWTTILISAQEAYFENFGTSSGEIPVASYTGYLNNFTQHTGNAVIVNNPYYPFNEGCVLLRAANTVPSTFTMNPLFLTLPEGPTALDMYVTKSNLNVDGIDGLTFEVYDGNSWMMLNSVNATFNGGSFYYNTSHEDRLTITFNGPYSNFIPNGVRFTNNSTICDYYIDTYTMPGFFLNTKENASKKYALYPNPVNNNLIFITNLPNKTPLEIFDITGKLIKNTLYSSEGISTEGLKSGEYVVKTLEKKFKFVIKN